MRFCFLGHELFEDGEQLFHRTNTGKLQQYCFQLPLAGSYGSRRKDHCDTSL